ncbi:MAG: EamA family transporter [Sphingobacterium sp.]|uniref:DMT family transporter n=1 Tax=Sphingobacterium sp. JB170 TaxID=1434842 RepID=UPI00097E7DCD|nr:DMT family transporter [Sphingobacterium sp. JB170]SJN45485.1 Integral membrane protein [Sphingobacterium sp. JB170]
MLYVLLSVICSVTVSVIIKIAKKNGANYLHLIVWNYPVAALATVLFLNPGSTNVSLALLPWGLYIALAILLPVIFLCIAYSIQYSGIVKTEIAQRLSLFLPLMAAFFIFHEEISLAKIIGIGVGVLAILLTIGWGKGKTSLANGKWGYAIAVFIGMGVIDILFKKIATYTNVPYVFSMLVVFILAMLVAFSLLFYNMSIRKQHIDYKVILWGILLGGFNFGNILFYMKAHGALSTSPSAVFTGMNIGVILVGAIVGVYIFKEQLSKYNKIGLLLAVLSVLIIAFS